MVKFTIDNIMEIMNKPENVRNISVIAHVDHGKTTLTDSLLAKCGIINEYNAGNQRATDTTDYEAKKGITTNSTAVSLIYDEHLINLIDSPGHIDFSAEVTAALRVTDGSIVVVDSIEGVCVQTETVLRQSISERIKPILFLNKIDRVFLELSPALDTCYENFRNSIESFNVICSTYADNKLGDIQCYSYHDKIGFGSGLHGWGFTLNTFAEMYTSKWSLNNNKMMRKLWGNNYFNNNNNKWIKNNNNNKLERGFCQFILKPIKVLCDAVMNNKKDIYEPIINGLRLNINKNDLQKCKKQKDILKLIMRTWLPVSDTLFNMIIKHLPSPVKAQEYRIENLYTGPLDSPEADAVRKCDSKGPMSMYVSKMVPTSEKGRFIAFGRVFSGTIKTGDECLIMGPQYKYGNKHDLFSKKIQRIQLMMGKYNETIQYCPAGNICGITGIDQCLLKSGTITNSDKIYPFKTMKFSVAAIVQMAIEPKNASDLPKLIDGLKKLSKTDQIIKCSTSKNGENIIHGAGELHLDKCLNDLKTHYIPDMDIKISDPIVSFAETINNKSKQICIAKSPNKLNRIYMNAQPLNNEFIKAIDNNEINLNMLNDKKLISKELVNKYNWNNDESRKIWSFGCPPESICNVLINKTKGVQYLDTIKDNIINSFMSVTCNGILCDEIIRGIKFNVLDAKIHRDPPHRNAGQIIPMSNRCFYACQLGSEPALLEPMYSIDITVPESIQNNVFNTLNKRRGEIYKINKRIGTPLTTINAYLPVLESFGFTELLRKNTGGQAFPQMKFSHWKPIKGNIYDINNLSYNIIINTRKRKGLKPEIPKFNDYYDKI